MKKLAIAALFLLSIFAVGCKKQETPAPATTEQAAPVATSTTTTNAVATPAAATPAAPATK